LTWFDQAFDYVMSHEGGYSDDPVDPGKATKYGISSRTYPDINIANLTMCQAKQIYLDDWWKLYGYDRIPHYTIAAKVFDLAINMGPSEAHKIFQRALHAAGQRHVTVDGVIGSQTLTAFSKTDPREVLSAMKAEAAWYYRNLISARPELKHFENGWLNRAYSDPGGDALE
jgi:lysozyme family protein